MKKKVFVIVPFLKGTGGTETVIRNLGVAYQRSGKTDVYDMRLISFGGTMVAGWQEPWKKKVYNFTANRMLQNIFYIILAPILMLILFSRERPDIVISTNSVLWTYAYFIRKFTRQHYSIIGWYHYSVDQKPINRNALTYCDSYLAISSGIKRQLVKRGISDNTIHTLYNPVDILNNGVLQSMVPRPEHGPTQFIYIGRIDFDGQKNVSSLFTALSNVRGDWTLRLYGTCTSETKSRLLHIAEINHFTQKVSFMGFKEDVWSEISVASALIMTSKYEGFPMILCEAIARGIYCISSDCPTGPEDIITEENGKLYPMDNIKVLSFLLQGIVNGSAKLADPKNAQKTMVELDFSHFIANFQRFIGVS
ncbi:glycosyltransferase [Lactiplantibacillus plantarum]|uniref:glycosyltransferase n=1 Tax=Lactiplantibacillus plantarum TaxID=1590 RepID=UPI000932A501|nr:glycosyltransferase [Lactiplantibacillus plantarum]